MAENKLRRKIKVVEVGGSPYEIGFQYGRACPEMRRLLEVTFQAFGGQEKARAMAGKYIPLYLPAARQYAPEIIDEMQGMADGAGLDFQDIFFLNITYEIAVQPLMGCTSFAFDGNAAKGGQVIAGQNFDFMADWQDILVLLKIKPDRGPGILALAPAGGLGLVGLNSAGITLNLNLLRNQSSLNPQGGVPTHIILRKVLTSQNLSEAIRKIATAEKRSAKNYLLTSAQGDIINLETTADDLDVSYAEKGILTHANYFKSERFRSTDLAGKFWPDAYIRSQRLLQLMSVLHGRLSVEVMQELLQDHNNYPNSICRHPDPENPIAAARMIKTLVSLISCPQERRIYLAQGNPCEYEYEEYTL